jgi:hypothetical protein
MRQRIRNFILERPVLGFELREMDIRGHAGLLLQVGA